MTCALGSALAAVAIVSRSIFVGLGLAGLGFALRRRAGSTNDNINHLNSNRLSREGTVVSRLQAFVAALGLSILIAGPAAATVVAPNGFEAVEGPEGINGPFAGEARTTQWVFPAADFAGITPGTELISIGFRVNGGATTNAQELNFAQWNLQLSTPQAPFPTLSTTFADNIGADVVTVRSGPLTIPIGALIGGPGPNPFFDLAFTTPYTYTGGPLLVTLNHTGAGIPVSTSVAIGSGSGLIGTVAATSFEADVGIGGFNGPITRFGTESVALPAPGTLMLFGLGLAGLGLAARRRSDA